MELKQALGNTWYLEDWQLIPLYRTDEHHCILLDSGLYEQRQAIEDALSAAGIVPIGILGSHAHNDHSSNHRYFQQKYHIPVALSLGEAGICCTVENLKSHFYINSLREFLANQRVRHMVVRADRIIQPEEREIDFCGVRFGILHTPGHSVDPIAVRTPDGVLYLGDALLSGAELEGARFPYHFRFEAAMETMRNLKREQANLFLCAHKGVYADLGDLPERNIQLIESRAEGIRALLEEEALDFSQLSRRTCETFRLRSRARGTVALYERNIRAYLEYLLDTGRVEPTPQDGVFRYRAVRPSPAPAVDSRTE